MNIDYNKLNQQETSLPLYQILKQELMILIEKMIPGEKLPTETELEKQYGVSRITVRRAVQELVLDGLVCKKQGYGTFIPEPKIQYPVQGVTSLTERLANEGLQIQTLSCFISEVVPSELIQKQLQLPDDQKLLCIKRVRSTSDKVFTIMINYLRQSIFDKDFGRQLKYESLYEHLKYEHQIWFEAAEETIETREATELEADMLEILPGDPVLFLTRISYFKGIPAEYTKVVIRGDSYKYRIHLKGKEEHL